MNNITAIKAMTSWINTNGKTPVPENYIDLYLDKIGFDNFVETENVDNEVDCVIDYNDQDIYEEIGLMENSVNTSYTEDCENMQEFVNTLMED
jgi:hypothetical protein